MPVVAVATIHLSPTMNPSTGYGLPRRAPPGFAEAGTGRARRRRMALPDYTIRCPVKQEATLDLSR